MEQAKEGGQFMGLAKYCTNKGIKLAVERGIYCWSVFLMTYAGRADVKTADGYLLTVSGEGSTLDDAAHALVRKIYRYTNRPATLVFGYNGKNKQRIKFDFGRE